MSAEAAAIDLNRLQRCEEMVHESFTVNARAAASAGRIRDDAYLSGLLRDFKPLPRRLQASNGKEISSAHRLRDDESEAEKTEYICHNPFAQFSWCSRYMALFVGDQGRLPWLDAGD